MNNEPVAWKAYEEVNFSDQYILRWVREGDEYVNRITKEMMEDFKSVVRQQQAEIEALTSYVIDYRDEYVPFINWAANRKAQKKWPHSPHKTGKMRNALRWLMTKLVTLPIKWFCVVGNIPPQQI